MQFNEQKKICERRENIISKCINTLNYQFNRSKVKEDITELMIKLLIKESFITFSMPNNASEERAYKETTENKIVRYKFYINNPTAYRLVDVNSLTIEPVSKDNIKKVIDGFQFSISIFSRPYNLIAGSVPIVRNNPIMDNTQTTLNISKLLSMIQFTKIGDENITFMDLNSFQEWLESVYLLNS